MRQQRSEMRRLALLGVLALSGCALGGQTPERMRMESEGPQAVVLNDASLATMERRRPQPIDTRAAATYHILVGELALRRDQPELAAHAFLAALRSEPDLDLAVRATQLALQAGDDMAALEAAEIWLRLDPNEIDAREVMLRVHLVNGRLEPALPHALTVVDGHAAGSEEGFRHLGLLLSRVPQRLGPAALELMSNVRDRRIDRSGSDLALGALALRFGDLELAEKAVADALAAAPNDHAVMLLSAGIKVRRGDVDEAMEMAERAFSSQPEMSRGELRLTFARVLLESGETEAAAKMLARALKDDEELIDARFMLGAIALQNDDRPEAQRWFETLIGTPRDQEAAMQLGQLAHQAGRLDEALAYYSGVTRGAAALDALTRRAVVLAELDRLDEARLLLHRVAEELPQAASRLLMIEVELLNSANQTDAALELLDLAISEQPDDVDLRYARALSLERSGDIPRAEEDLRVVLDADENDARALNALGYLLVLQGERLDEARDLIDRALVIEPNDPAIIDSKGWLLFKQGDVEGSLPWLQRAYAAYPDAEVAAHLGEVLWTLGRQDEARRIWNDAAKADADHPVLRETMERLAPTP